MLHVLVNKFKYRYFKLKEEIQSPGSWHLYPFAIILSRHTSASLRLCETIFFKLFNQSRKARKDAETQRIKNIGMTGIHHSLSRTGDPIQL
jgi:hypothetical protein